MSKYFIANRELSQPGGTRSSTVTGISRANVRPSQVRFGDRDMQNVAPMYWYGGRINESTALDEATLISNQHTLDMIFQKQYPTPPVPEQ